MRLVFNEQENEGPNLTPVIDVVFLLLIFFLVATRFDEEERDLKVNLPEVAQAQPRAMTPELIVNVSRDGKYKVVQREYSERELLALLTQTREKNPQQKVLIRADGDAAWKHGVRVMGLCNKARIEKYDVAALEQN